MPLDYQKCNKVTDLKNFCNYTFLHFSPLLGKYYYCLNEDLIHYKLFLNGPGRWLLYFLNSECNRYFVFPMKKNGINAVKKCLKNSTNESSGTFGIF